MTRLHTLLLVLSIAAGALAVASSPGQERAAKAYLLNVGKGQTFSEIGSDDKTKPEAVESKGLGGKALKVAFARGDAEGQGLRLRGGDPSRRLQAAGGVSAGIE
jgi:hypothetical protein